MCSGAGIECPLSIRLKKEDISSCASSVMSPCIFRIKHLYPLRKLFAYEVHGTYRTVSRSPNRGNGVHIGSCCRFIIRSRGYQVDPRCSSVTLKVGLEILLGVGFRRPAVVQCSCPCMNVRLHDRDPSRMRSAASRPGLPENDKCVRYRLLLGLQKLVGIRVQLTYGCATVAEAHLVECSPTDVDQTAS